jgi:hypothetical protein
MELNNIMRVLFITVIILLASLAFSLQNIGPSENPKEVVEQLWNMAAAGDLLNSKGWNEASRLFTESDSAFSIQIINVVSNHYGVDRPVVQGNTAKVIVWYGGDVGQINSLLQFRPSPLSTSAKTPFPYALVLAHRQFTTVDQDGKTVTKEMTGSAQWQISSSRQPSWATVNAAIRYVLEMRSKTHDPAIQSNADKTVKALLHYQ